MRTIALEEHFDSAFSSRRPGKGRHGKHGENPARQGRPKLVAQLADIGDARVAEMDAAEARHAAIVVELAGYRAIRAG